MTSPQAREVRQIGGLGEISERYDAVFCDIWGVLHNGVAAFPAASEALVSFRRGGGSVVLISNAPRPSEPVRRQLLEIGVTPDAYDAIATSGDVAASLIAERIDDPVLHIGPSRDLSLFEEATGLTGRKPVLVAIKDARYSVCTGLRDDVRETADDYEAELRAMADTGMTMICANPDVVIHRGDTLVYCAGALAQKYEQLGGLVVYAGKPHGPIYKRATALVERARSNELRKGRILAVGDGMKTDIAGAAGAGLDSLFVTSGIHRDALHRGLVGDRADADQLTKLCREWDLWPSWAIGALRS